MRILSIVPYPVWPPRSGGHQAIVQLHTALNALVEDVVVGVKTPELASAPFPTLPLFGSGKLRYLPFRNVGALVQYGKKSGITHLLCEHPYMAPTAHRAASRLGVPWFLRSHNIESERFRKLRKPWWKGLAALEQWAMQQAAGTFFITAEDKEWAIQKFKIPEHKAHVVPFGTQLSAPPQDTPVRERLEIASNHALNAEKTWLYFIGANAYPPNADAVSDILTHIAPQLQDLPVELLILGGGLAEPLQRSMQAQPHMHYLGFVDDPLPIIRSCAVMLNPMLSGGGIKTKAIEALANNRIVISTANGAEGLDRKACGASLLIAPDRDCKAFVEDIRSTWDKNRNTPESFYRFYATDSIARHVVGIMESARVR